MSNILQIPTIYYPEHSLNGLSSSPSVDDLIIEALEKISAKANPRDRQMVTFLTDETLSASIVKGGSHE